MEKTYLQTSGAYIARIIKEGKKSPHAPEYQKICKSLESLVKITNKLTDRNHKMTSEEFKKLSKGYANVQKACKDYMVKADEFNDFEKDRKGIISVIASVLKKDIHALKECNPMNPGTLSEIFDKARTYKIVLNPDTIKKVGGNLSSRIPIRTNSGMKGFFTPKSIYEPDKEWEAKMKIAQEKFGAVSDRTREKIKLLKNNDKLQTAFSYCIQSRPISQVDKYNTNTQKRIAKLAAELGMGNNIKEIESVFRNNKELYTELFDFSNSMVGLANKHVIMADTGIKKGANISSRNCAMTDMARLLGCENVLANSVPMKVVIDGKEVEGVFMETAEGSDINRLHEDDLILKAGWKSFDSPDALMQVTDIQVLDFICGNTDRHPGNMVYQFKETPEGVKFTGIKGIDNDCCFGTPKIRPNNPIMRMVNPESMKFISKKMLNRLNEITPAMLQAALANDNLSKEEIDAALDRMNMVKQAVKENKIEVIDRKHWVKNDLDINGFTDNYFSKIKDMQDSCAGKGYEDNVNTNNRIDYAQETTLANNIMAEKQSAISILRKKLDDPAAKAKYFNTSEYNLMKNRFETIEKLTKELDEKYPDKKNAPEKLINDLRNAYIELADKTERYVELKKLVPSTERGQKRLEIARELMGFANDTLKELGIEFKKETGKKSGKQTKEKVDEPIFEENDPILEGDEAGLTI